MMMLYLLVMNEPSIANLLLMYAASQLNDAIAIAVHRAQLIIVICCCRIVWCSRPTIRGIGSG
jgi:hypothetical protein